MHTHMCECVCVNICAQVHTHMCICVCEHVCTSAYSHVCMCMCEHVCTSAYSYVHTCMYEHGCMGAYSHVCMCMCERMCIHVHGGLGQRCQLTTLPIHREASSHLPQLFCQRIHHQTGSPPHTSLLPALSCKRPSLSFTLP